jgi:competence protein ComEA
MQFGRILALVVALAAPFSVACAQTPAAHAPAPSTAAAPAAKPAAAMAPAKAPLLDINTASEADLSALKQIGPVRSKAIIAGRPFKSKDQLVSKNILTQGVYDKIKDKIIAKQ